MLGYEHEFNQYRKEGIYDLPAGMDELVEPQPMSRLADNPRQRLVQRIQTARQQGNVFVSVAIADLEAVLHASE